VNFENTVIVMTTNAGSSLASNAAGFGKSTNEQTADKTMRALEQFLRPEFLNRVDEIITFRQLDEQDFAAIARIMLSQLAGVLDERGIKLQFTDAAAEYVAKESYSVKYGARNMRRYIQKHLEDELATKIIASYEIEITGVHLDVKDDAFEITCL
jgi:ATP-dependent Clp protease ATP-binding subunit ClpA